MIVLSTVHPWGINRVIQWGFGSANSTGVELLRGKCGGKGPVLCSVTVTMGKGREVARGSLGCLGVWGLSGLFSELSVL